jgi:hypothetical protein
MKSSVNFCAFTDAFHAYKRYEQFGYEALQVLFDYLEEYEDSTGEEIELDVIALCCDYAHDTVQEIADNYSIDLDDCEDDEEKRDAVRVYLEDHTSMCGETDTGFVYCSAF